jgi:hypothetical protein
LQQFRRLPKKAESSKSLAKPTIKAVNRHRVDIGTWLLSEVEPPFLSDDCLSIEARLSHFHTYFSNSLPGPNRDIRRRPP